MSKRVLLTGAGGGVGVHVLAHILTNTDWDVIVLDSFRHKGYRERITRVCRNHPDWPARVKVIQHDLVCPISASLHREIGPIDHMLHLAALSDVFFSIENPAYTIHNNVSSTLMLLEYARIAKPETFLYFSTDEVYGPVTHPGEGHAEWSTHRPSNAYAASKAACEDIAYAYWRSYELPLIITNTMNNFGEMQSAEKYPVKIQKWVEAGEKVVIHASEEEIGSRFYIHSRNVSDALLYILQRGAYVHQTGVLDEPHKYHIVGDTNYNNLELAQTIAKLMDKPLDYELVDFHKDNPAHDIHYGLQDNKLRPDWQQPVDTETSLKNTIEWQQRNQEWIQ